MKISGLPQHYKGIYLAYFNYGATGEGETTEAQIVYDGKFAEVYKGDKNFKKQLKIGWDDPFTPKFIPAAVEEKLYNIKYLTWNFEFKSRFLESFGQEAFNDFEFCSSKKAPINLLYKMHYNLS